MESDWQHLLFKFLSFSPGPFWLILLFIPLHKKAMIIFDAYLLLLSAIFSILVIPDVSTLLPMIAEPTLEGINSFLGSFKGTLGAWNHMILGDLWIGRWLAYDAIKLNVKGFVRAPFILVILFFGPLGLFFYLLFRMFGKKNFRLA